MTRILLLALALLATPASAAVEMSFWSHELESVGPDIDYPHAFVLFSGTPDAGGRPVTGNYGFTAATISLAILTGPVKGAILSADKAYIAKSRRQLTLRLTDAQYASVRAAFARWKTVRGNSYDLENRNCVHFIAEMARAAGLAVPNDPSLVKKPSAFLSALAAKNPGRTAAR